MGNGRFLCWGQQSERLYELSLGAMMVADRGCGFSAVRMSEYYLADPTMMRTALTSPVAETRQVWLGAAEDVDP